MIEYSSSDVGAHVLTNANNSLATLFRKVLVGTAGIAWGSKASAGWTEPFASASNVSVFKQGAGGNNRYIRFFDGGQNPVGTRRVNLRAYEAMTALSTGTNPFPTTGQVAGNGCYFPYLQDNGGVYTGAYRIWADSKYLIALIDGYAPNKYWNCFVFGTIPSRKAGDTFCDVLLAGGADNTAPWTMQLSNEGSTAGDTACYIARSDAGTAGSKAVLPVRGIAGCTGGYWGNGSPSFPYPERVKGGLVMSQPQIWADNYWRATKLPGMWEAAHAPASWGAANGVTFSGQGALAGKTFEAFGPMLPQYIGVGFLIIETSDTWN